MKIEIPDNSFITEIEFGDIVEILNGGVYIVMKEHDGMASLRSFDGVHYYCEPLPLERLFSKLSHRTRGINILKANQFKLKLVPINE